MHLRFSGGVAAAGLLLLLLSCEMPAAPAFDNAHDPLNPAGGVPGMPGDLRLVSAGATEATLTWTDRSSIDAGVVVERRDVPHGTFATVGVVYAPNVAFTDTGLTSNVPREYRLRAFTDLHHSPYSDTLALVYPQRAFAGHTSTTHAVAFSPDGTLLATCGLEEVRLWRVADGALLHVLEGHNYDVHAVAFSPDGTLLASGGSDGVRLWRTADGAFVRSLKIRPDWPFNANEDWINAVAFSPDGTLVAAAGNSDTLHLWRTEDGRLHRALTGHSGSASDVAFSPDGTRLLSAGGGTLRLWTLPGGMPLRTWPVAAIRVAFSPDGTRFAAGDEDRTVRLFDADGTELHVLSAPGGFDGATGYVNGLAFSPDGETLAFAWHDRVLLHYTADGAFQRSLVLLGQYGLNGAFARRVAFSPDGRTLAAGSHDSAARLWNLDAAWTTP